MKLNHEQIEYNNRVIFGEQQVIKIINIKGVFIRTPLSGKYQYDARFLFQPRNLSLLIFFIQLHINSLLILLYCTNKMTTHYFLIHDTDSNTNFMISDLPRKLACGYDFKTFSDPSTNQPNSHRSSSSNSEEQNKTQPMFQDDFSLHSSTKKDHLFHQSSIRKHLEDMQEFYSFHQIDAAYSEAKKLKKLCSKINHKLSEEENQLLNQVENEMNDVFDYHRVLYQEGWELRTEKKNIRVSSKNQGDTVGVLVEATIDVPIEIFLSILTEIDLMKTWMPFMESSSLQKIVSRNCRIGHCVNNFPILSKRQSFFQGIGYDRMNYNKTVFMYTRSLNQRKDLQKLFDYKVHENENAVQLDYKYFILEFVPETKSKGFLRMALNIDMKLKIPMFIMTPATTGFGLDFYNNILKMAKNFEGSEFEKKVQQKPEFFNLVKIRIEQYFPSLNSNQ